MFQRLTPQVLTVMLKIVAPIVPHLAEEVYEAAGQGAQSSVFLDHWSPEVCCIAFVALTRDTMG